MKISGQLWEILPIIFNIMSKISKFISVLIPAGILFYFLCLNHINIGKIGIAYNSISGKYWVQNSPGWYITSPAVRVCSISILPFNASVLWENKPWASVPKINKVKLIQFNPSGVDEFLSLHGFHWYFDDEIYNILAIYGLYGEKHTFLTILE